MTRALLQNSRGLSISCATHVRVLATGHNSQNFDQNFIEYDNDKHFLITEKSSNIYKKPNMIFFLNLKTIALQLPHTHIQKANATSSEHLKQKRKEIKKGRRKNHAQALKSD